MGSESVLPNFQPLFLEPPKPGILIPLRTNIFNNSKNYRDVPYFNPAIRGTHKGIDSGTSNASKNTIAWKFKPQKIMTRYESCLGAPMLLTLKRLFIPGSWFSYRIYSYFFDLISHYCFISLSSFTFWAPENETKFIQKKIGEFSQEERIPKCFIWFWALTFRHIVYVLSM